MIEMMISIKQ